MQFQLQVNGAVELPGFGSICQQDKWIKQQEGVANGFYYNNEQEPTSVLHMRRSQSPPTSASTPTSSFNGGAGGGNSTENTTNTAATIAPPNNKEEWATELRQIPSEIDLVPEHESTQRCNIGLGDWETLLSESAVSPSQDHSLLRWIAGDAGSWVVDPSPGFEPIGSLATSGNVLSSAAPILGGFPDSGFVPNPNNNDNGKVGVATPSCSSVEGVNNHKVLGATVGLDISIQDIISASPDNSIGLPVTLPTLYQQQQQDLEKRQILMGRQRHQQRPQNPNFSFPLPQEQDLLEPLPKRLNAGNLEFSSQIPKLAGHELFIRKQLQQHMVAEEEVLELLHKAAELVGTGNFAHARGILARLNHQLSPVGKPFQRAAFYIRKALQLLITNNSVSPPPPKSPTRFDVIFKLLAYKWASFMQELPMRIRGVRALRITAFASPLTHHPIELGLMRESLMLFANEIGLSFELVVLNFDSLDQAPYSLPLFRTNQNEAVAVNFPVWSSSNQPSALPNLLRFVKQLSPKIVVSLDGGWDRNDLPFPELVTCAFQSYKNIFESLDAGNVTSDVVNKIERFLIVPRIESTMLGRLRAPENMPLWKTLLCSSGFTPVTFSNFTITQADCVVKRAQVRGFHVEKRQPSLVLCWQQRELISASAWRC
ncbi:hypothetical protein ES319_A08G181600v1 [Gossypium barbadense]|uniref:Uncharacterized protein n=1 Tax=Gossypium barbadense TaxID=3634 RepID=A0A5J5UUE2_GOSBA|nr:hypothetical protein ES319_A08G181600v1 [Gossypium barbadense]